jgi:hypothetical protein
LFYRAATALVDRALRRPKPLTVAEALAVLLQTWNRAYYRYKKFDAKHYSDIEALLKTHRRSLIPLRKRHLETVTAQEQPMMVETFQHFEEVLGPVGAAKALHLLAPHFFPLWDRKITEAYGGALGKAGTNGERYWQFMLCTQEQCRKLRGAGWQNGKLLKTLDEHNYCKYTKGWR